MEDMSKLMGWEGAGNYDKIKRKGLFVSEIQF